MTMGSESVILVNIEYEQEYQEWVSFAMLEAEQPNGSELVIKVG